MKVKFWYYVPTVKEVEIDDKFAKILAPEKISDEELWDLEDELAAVAQKEWKTIKKENEICDIHRIGIYPMDDSDPRFFVEY